MSVWSDMMDRGVGDLQKKEDEVTKWPEYWDVSEYRDVIWPDLPKAVKVQSKTISQDLVDVQPMSPPIGKVFYM